MTVATVRLGYSLAGLVLGTAVLALAAIVSGALPTPVASLRSAGAPAPAAATPIAGPILGGGSLSASAPSAMPKVPTVVAPAAVAVAAPVVVAPLPTTAAPTPAPAPASAGDRPPGAAKTAIATYRYGGRRYSGVITDPVTTIVAPSAATVQVRTYQLVDGDVRVGSNVPWLPFFSYVTLTTADSKLTYRPGALRADTELLIEDGDEVAAGTPLFRIVGAGASSWATFYDPSVAYNVVVSLVAMPSGADLDAAPLIATR